MTFEQALQVHLSKIDEVWTELRKQLADPTHVNIESRDYKGMYAQLVARIEAIFALKSVIATTNNLCVD